jgi:hypothetical protein
LATLTFSANAAGFTARVRDFVLNGQFAAAMDCLDGLPEDAALAVMRGDMKFIDDPEGEMFCVDDDDKDYKAKLRAEFSGTFSERRGTFHRPQAIITSYGPEDYDPLQHNSTDNSYRNENYRLYASDIVRTVIVPEGVTKIGSLTVEPGRSYDVLFTLVARFPDELLKAFETPQAAFEDFVTDATYIREIGYLKEFGDCEYTDPTTKDGRPLLGHTVSGKYPFSREDLEVLTQWALDRKDDAFRLQLRETYLERAKDQTLTGRERVLLKDNAYYLVTDGDRAVARDGYREVILDQANGDLYSFTYKYGDGLTATVDVPRAPLFNWALRVQKNPSRRLIAPEWKPVSPAGVKMGNDDPYHTDWMLGGGLDLKLHNDQAFQASSLELMQEIQAKLLNFKVTVLNGSGKAYGTVEHIKRGKSFDPNLKVDGMRIGIISAASADYVFAAEEAIKNGWVLISQTGGTVTHLVSEYRGTPLRLVVEAGALVKYHPGIKITVDLDEGRIIEGFDF